MRKTIDLDEEDIKKIEKFRKENNIKTFSESARSIIRKLDGALCTCEDECSCETNKISDDNFALLADALIQINDKLDQLLTHIAPKSAGEVK